MEYRKVIQLKDGRMCVLRNGTEEDGQALLDIFLLTHSQTDYLLTYPVARKLGSFCFFVLWRYVVIYEDLCID